MINGFLPFLLLVECGIASRKRNARAYVRNIIRCSFFRGTLFCSKRRKNASFLKFFKEKFWRFKKKRYLCTRF